jgi:hypothetical protein
MKKLGVSLSVFVVILSLSYWVYIITRDDIMVKEAFAIISTNTEEVAISTSLIIETKGSDIGPVKVILQIHDKKLAEMAGLTEIVISKNANFQYEREYLFSPSINLKFFDKTNPSHNLSNINFDSKAISFKFEMPNRDKVIYINDFKVFDRIDYSSAYMR